MHPTLRVGVAGVLSAACLAGLIVVAGAAPAASPAGEAVNIATPFVEREQFGTLELRTDPGGGLSVRFVAAGTDEVVNLTPRRGDRCEVVTGADGRRTLDEFLDLEVVAATIGADGVPGTTPIAVPPALGLVDNGIGSREQNNCNRNNGRIEPGQGLVITLGSDPRFDDVVFDYGFLDIEGKFGADLYGETSLGGAAVDTVSDPLGGPNDNDPDSGASDNWRVPVGTAPATGVGTMGDAGDDFDRLVILPANSAGDGTYFFDRGQLALEGGGDFGDGTNRTVFNLVTSQNFEYTLVCESETADVYVPNGDGTVKGIVETPADFDWSILEDPDGAIDYPAEARLFRYQGFQTNADGLRVPKPCPPIGADLSADGGGVLLEPSDDNAFLRLELTWVIPAALVDLADGDPFARKIDLDGDGPLIPQDARYCDGFDGTDSFEPTAPGDVIHPANTPWCVVTDERTLTQIDGVDVVVQRMVWDGLGDPRFF